MQDNTEVLYWNTEVFYVDQAMVDAIKAHLEQIDALHAEDVIQRIND